METETFRIVKSFYLDYTRADEKYKELCKEEAEAEKKEDSRLYRSILASKQANISYKNNMIEKFINEIDKIFSESDSPKS